MKNFQLFSHCYLLSKLVKQYAAMVRCLKSSICITKNPWNVLLSSQKKVYRVNPAFLFVLHFSYTVLFSQKKDKKITKNLSKTCH